MISMGILYCIHGHRNRTLKTVVKIRAGHPSSPYVEAQVLLYPQTGKPKPQPLNSKPLNPKPLNPNP